MLRAITVLSALAAVVMLTTGARQTGEAQAPQVPQLSNAQLVAKFDTLQRRVKETNHKIHPCPDAKPYIKAKRTATWKWQDLIYVPRTRTNYAERRTHGCAYLKWLGKRWATNAHDAFSKHVELREPRAAICHVFGVYCSQALTVSWCESRHNIWADNGQYLGLFQMGKYARGKYGHSNTALGQARSAHNYFVESGRDWSPWSCKP